MQIIDDIKKEMEKCKAQMELIEARTTIYRFCQNVFDNKLLS